MDEVYIKKIRNGDTESFRYFLTTYKDWAFSLAMSIVKDEFHAEEAVQEAFIRAFRKLGSFNQRSKFRTWFYRIVVNESFKLLKKQKKEIVDFGGIHGTDVVNEDELLALNGDEQAYLINEGLKKLSPNESLALRLFYLEEENIKTVCEITGWSESNVKVTLHRARKNMRIVLNRLMRSSI